MPRPGLEPGPPDPESSALTIRPPCLPLRYPGKMVRTVLYKIWNNICSTKSPFWWLSSNQTTETAETSKMKQNHQNKENHHYHWELTINRLTWAIFRLTWVIFRLSRVQGTLWSAWISLRLACLWLALNAIYYVNRFSHRKYFHSILCYKALTLYSNYLT